MYILRCKSYTTDDKQGNVNQLLDNNPSIRVHGLLNTRPYMSHLRGQN